ncbi:hypothetical protein [Microbulbifer epialgicus]|uniref:Uncharacterized protein n=1 Tax=Microbulbifer epialgicus TaxID=393907 RepID=A0ABV4NV14_9GAMM
MSNSNHGYTTGHNGHQYEILFDSLRRRLWINADDGSAVARFNTATGVDIHNTASDQMAGAPECLWCTHGKPDYKTWQEFIKFVRHQFGIKLFVDDIDVSLLLK